MTTISGSEIIVFYYFGNLKGSRPLNCAKAESERVFQQQAVGSGFHGVLAGFLSPKCWEPSHTWTVLHKRFCLSSGDIQHFFVFLSMSSAELCTIAVASPVLEVQIVGMQHGRAVVKKVNFGTT